MMRTLIARIAGMTMLMLATAVDAS